MRAYTSPSEKIEKYSVKYGKSKEEIHRILTENEALLTLDELKIKYDDPNLGILPDWLSEEDFDLMIWKSIHTLFDQKYSYWTTKEDLHSDLYIFLKERMKLYKNKAYLKTAAMNRLRWLLKQQILRSQYYDIELDAQVCTSDDNTSRTTYSEVIPATQYLEEEVEFLNTIRDIKNESVKHFLIATGYLIANIACLRPMYIELLRVSDDEIKANFSALEERLNTNDLITARKSEEETTTRKTRCAKLKLQDIVRALKLNIEEETITKINKKTGAESQIIKYHKTSPLDVLDELKYYIKAANIV